MTQMAQGEVALPADGVLLLVQLPVFWVHCDMCGQGFAVRCAVSSAAVAKGAYMHMHTPSSSLPPCLTPLHILLCDARSSPGAGHVRASHLPSRLHLEYGDPHGRHCGVSEQPRVP